MDLSEGSVVLVGAGPGDPDLITVRGVKALRQADAVVYDYLAPSQLLACAPSEAERVYVGKKAGQHTMSQAEINALLIQLAGAGKRVVRLKGGDPFVFGRGGEEAEALAEAGIPFEVVPGVTSAVAVPAYAGIPVTHRGVAASFAVVTGHEDPGKAESSLDWDALARVDTLVILMGVGNLPQIVEELTRRGREMNTPVALIQWGTLGVQRTVAGTLSDIVQRVEDAGLRAPAVAVVGDVVALRQRLRWFDRKPLHDLRVLVTRTRKQASQLSSALRAHGAEPVECSLIETEAPLDWQPLDSAILQLGVYDWVVFTSANGVAAFFERLWLAGLDARMLALVSVAAIGPATAEALASHGVRADLMPAEYVAEAVAEAMGEVRGQRVLLPRADIARPALAERLAQAGAQVDEVAAYRTVRPDGLAARLREAVQNVDVITFTSSSTVRHFVEALGDAEAKAVASRAAVACIGPITAETASHLGLSPQVVAQEYTIDGLVSALVAWREGTRTGNGGRDTP